MTRPPIYDPEAVKPLWRELEQVGVKPISTAEEVTDYLINKPGVTMIVVNSICGCAAGMARPGVMLALQHQLIPDNLCTVFAGQDHEAVDKARSLMTVPPSSPMIALFENGKMIFALQRSEIERANRQHVAAKLTDAFEKFCSAKGPSVPTEVYEKIIPVTKCGSKIPAFRG
jgi:putative YphP/YqiW family bacilliredoxin